MECQSLQDWGKEVYASTRNERETCDLLWLFPNGLRTDIGKMVLAATVEAAGPVLGGI